MVSINSIYQSLVIKHNFFYCQIQYKPNQIGTWSTNKTYLHLFTSFHDCEILEFSFQNDDF